jgi:outer membrane protein TolC
MKSGRAALAAIVMMAVGISPAAAQQTAAAEQNSPFMGSVPKGTATSEPMALSVKDAVDRALKNNLGLLLQEEAESSAHGERWRALASLLPNLSGSLKTSRQVLNLEAFGFPAPNPIVGPFNVVDARVSLSESVLDFSALNDARAAALNEQAAKFGVKTARDLVVLVAVNLYLEADAAASRVDMTHAQLDTAQALFKQAQDLKSSGIVAGLDVVRAQVQVETQRQRVIASENDLEKIKLQLARAIGIPIGQPLSLTDKISYAPLPIPSVDASVAQALAQRSDYLEAKARFDAAQATERGANAALLPSVTVDADYGAIGQTPSTAHSTYTMAANLHIPIFDGGKTTARRIEAASAARQREAELADFKSRVEYDVRTSLLDLKAADQQLQAAQTNVQLANEELTQARDRFAAGVAGNLEVTQAQETVASASDTYVSALYSHNLAKASLARALGIAESAVTAYLGGR